MRNNKEDFTMTHLEMVEKLRETTGLSYEEAKLVLERNHWDILDAMIELERSGKTSGSASYSTPEKKPVYTAPAGASQKKKADNGFTRAMKWCWELAKKSCRNSLAAIRKGETMLELPILVFLILLCTCFWIIVPVMVVGLFFDIRYRFQGPDIRGNVANAVMDSAADAAQDLREKVREKIDEEQNNDI